MNKRKTIIIVIIIWIIAALMIGIVAVTSKAKTPISSIGFATTMSSKGYKITDASDQLAQYEYVTKVYIAGNKSTNYQIEFYELSDDTMAKSFFNQNKTKFENQKESASAETNVKGKNYSKYTLSTGNKYKVLSRIDNTVIYLDVYDSYEEEVKNILGELGY